MITMPLSSFIFKILRIAKHFAFIFCMMIMIMMIMMIMMMMMLRTFIVLHNAQVFGFIF